MLDLNILPLPDLAERLLSCEIVDRLLDLALAEDLGAAGDITTASIIDPGRHAVGLIRARQEGVVSGLAVAQRLLARAGLDGALHVQTPDGSRCQAGTALAKLECSLMDLLKCERPILNFLSRMSGIATMTRRYVEAIAGMDAVICDTRKTTPGLRHLEKYAVRCGGGLLHRIALYDAALFKDNHLAHIPPAELQQQLALAARRIRQNHDVRFVEVEVDSLEQFQQVLNIEFGLIDIVLLDNMQPETMARAVQMRNEAASPIKLEASGGVGLQSVRAIAESGVERIAVGAITHSAVSIDVGLDMEIPA